MLQNAKIKIRDLKELQDENIKIKIRDLKELQDENIIAKQNTITPLKKCKKPKFASTTTSKKRENKQEYEDDANNNIQNNANINKTNTTAKKRTKFSIKDTPANQKTIDSYFTSCAKTYVIKFDPAPTPLGKQNDINSTKNKTRKTPTKNRFITGRKRLFMDTDTEPSSESNYQVECKKGGTTKMSVIDCITIDSDSGGDDGDHEMEQVKIENVTLTSPKSSKQQLAKTPPYKETNKGSSLKNKQEQITHDSATSSNDKRSQTTQNSRKSSSVSKKPKNSIIEAENPSSTNSPASSLKDKQEHIAHDSARSLNDKLSHTSQNSKNSSSETTPVSQKPQSSNMQDEIPSSTNSSVATFSRRKPKPCPPYKIIENTTFAVDAFQFGYIDNVTHYFLTHFHADHYIGLTKSFAKPLYVSPITARLLRIFIPVEEQYINELELNKPLIIDNIEITAIDANHCPGAILLVFKFLDTGKCILHTGDFRAWHGMESEPIFWNNNIHTIYLDTTYISDKYAFCSQDESIEKAKELIEKFHSKNPNKKVLYICGSYIVGKEKFWCKLAEIYKLKVWAEGNRYKALQAINDTNYNEVLVEEPMKADMHVIAMGKLTYFELVEYFKKYEQDYDVVLGIRPSGWEKDTKPRLSGKINLIGIEYSEHSSFNEMQRFVKFLKPQKVISTVPKGKDPMITAEIPENWYKYDKLKPQVNYQPSIHSYMTKTPLRKAGAIRPPNINKGGLENFVSPLQSIRNKKSREMNNNLREEENIESLLMPLNVRAEVQEEIFVPLNNDLENNEILEKPIKICAISLHSSEEFEKPDLVISQKRLNNNTEKLKKKDTNIKEEKEKILTGETEQSNILNKTKQEEWKLALALDSEECFETPNVLLSEKKAPVIKKPNRPKKITKLNNSIVNNTSQQKPNETVVNHVNPLADKEFEPKLNLQLNKNLEFAPTQERRITRSKSSSSSNKTLLQNSASKLNTKENINVNSLRPSEIKNKSAKLSPEKENKKNTHSQTKFTNINLNEEQLNNFESKSSSSNKSSSLQEQETKIKPSKLTPKQENNNRLRNSYLKQSQTKAKSPKPLPELETNNSSQILTKSQNPLLKSTTTTSRESISSQELTTTPKNSQNSKRKSKKRINTRNSEKSSDDNERVIKPKRSKRLKANQLKPNTKDILTNIMEESIEDLDRLNCSQLACKVMDTYYKQNPDDSKDHIPKELLTDDEDDNNSWKTAAEFEPDQNLNTEKITNFQTKLNSDSNSSKNLIKSKTPSLESRKSSHTNLKSIKKQRNKKLSHLNHQFNDEELSYLPSTSQAAENRNKNSNLQKLNKSPLHELINTSSLDSVTSKISQKTYKYNKYNKKEVTNSPPNTELSDLTKTLEKLKSNELEPELNLKLINEDITYDHTQFSQLAGLVIERNNKLNPDTINDHIPIELLSDADDDWM